MDKNAKRRHSYAEMDRHKKEALLKRRRERYALRKGTTSANHRDPDHSTPICEGHVDIPCPPANTSTLNSSLGCAPPQTSSSLSMDMPTSSFSLPASYPSHSDVHAQSDIPGKQLAGKKKGGRKYNEKLVGQTTRAHVNLDVYRATKDEASKSLHHLTEQSRSLIEVRDELNEIRTFVLPSVPNCAYCNAIRFYLEPPGFCCSHGEISLVPSEMPHELARFYTESDDESVEFRKIVRTYNNNLAFTTFSAKSDPELLKNNKGVYTFKIQGKVHHLLSSLMPDGSDLRGLQLYFYDTEDEVSKRIEQCSRFKENTIRKLISILSDNPYRLFLKQVKDLRNIDDYRIFLNVTPDLDQRTHNLPTSSEVSAIVSCDDEFDFNPRCHIQVYTKRSVPYNISHNYACYDPLQYPLLFPRGESGWHIGIEKLPETNKKHYRRRAISRVVNSKVRSAAELIEEEEAAAKQGNRKRDMVSCRQYYCYKFQIRPSDKSMILHTGRLFQQFIVDMFTKIESSRLDYYKKMQKDIRTEYLEGIIDSIVAGHRTGFNIGKKIILPPSFIGGPRDMRKRYLDAMSLVQRFGKPDFFITMTCNPSWPEITTNLLPNELPQNRPDLLARVFRAKVESLKNEIMKERIFGNVSACVYSIEFQKRGLPHCHMLLIMKNDSKPLNPEAYDRFISAELPCPRKCPVLYSIVSNQMMHGPCGSLNRDNVCMKNGKCKHKYPKPFLDQTTHGNNSYPHYRRRKTGITTKVRGHILDNQWVVPYNPYLLQRYDCHLNVEICSTVKLVKYIYKYIYKGPDKIAFHISNTICNDEITEYQNGRWISPPEAAWRIFAFDMFEMYPNVMTLQVHLPDNYPVTFSPTTDLHSLINNPHFAKTMLTEFFLMNKFNNKARELCCLYRDFPQYFVWNSANRYWKERKQQYVIGRVVTVNPSEGDRYYLRLLLSHVRAPTSFDYLLTVNGYKHKTFREAALRLGLLTSDNDIECCLEEGSLYQMPSQLRHLFATILVYCEPKNPRYLWEKFESSMSEDYCHHFNNVTPLATRDIRRRVLEHLSFLIDSMGKKLSDYHLCDECDLFDIDSSDTKEVSFEKSLTVSEHDLLCVKKLNDDQMLVYDSIMSKILNGQGGAFFIDGPGGTGKTFLYRAILSTLRSQGNIALATATSGVAAAILPGGRTAHSRFKLPLHSDEPKIAKLSKQSGVAKLILMSKVIIWDEAPMAHKHAIESFEEMLRDITEIPSPFGGKVVVFGGDFRQVLPVIKRGSRIDQINSSLVTSHVWTKFVKFQLSQNMRAISDPWFTDFLLRIGDGTESEDENGNITLPNNILLPFIEKDKSLTDLIQCVYPRIHAFIEDPESVMDRALLAPTNECVDDINDKMIHLLPGEAKTYVSTDRTLDPVHQSDYEDFINSLNLSSLPPHLLTLKYNSPVILLRNLNPTEGFCNGTRLVCKDLKDATIRAEIAAGPYIGKSIILNKIPLQSSDDEKSGIPFKRYQFPIRLCFAMTINKAQGQTLDFVGVYLREPVFSHGQLYVALSRAKKSSSIKVLIVPATFSDEASPTCTRNIVYHEVLEKSKVVLSTELQRG